MGIKFRVIKSIKNKITGEVIIPHSIVDIPGDKTIPLLMTGKVTPEGNCAYRIESSVLGCTLWVCHDEKAKESLISRGVTEAIYTRRELELLRGPAPEEMRAVHRAKETFPEATIMQKEGEPA